MRHRLGTAVLVLVCLCSIVEGWPEQGKTTDQLASYRARTAEQKIRATFFAQDVPWPLKPGATRIDNGEEDFGLPSPPQEYTSYLRDLTCSSDVVIVGRPTQKQAFLADKDSAIFTDYSVAPEGFLRGKINQQPGKDTTLLVTLRGGTIDTPGGPIEVRDQQPMDLNGRYVLFLTQIPQTTSYRLSGPYFVAGGTYPGIRTKRKVPAEVTDARKTTSSLVADIRSISGRCPSGGAK